MNRSTQFRPVQYTFPALALKYAEFLKEGAGSSLKIYTYIFIHMFSVCSKFFVRNIKEGPVSGREYLKFWLRRSKVHTGPGPGRGLGPAR